MADQEESLRRESGALCAQLRELGDPVLADVLGSVERIEALIAALEGEPDEELTITLRKPVSLGSVTYETLVLREPTAAECAQLDGLRGTTGDMTAVSIISGVPLPAVQKMGIRDVNKGAKYISRFLG